MKPIEPGCLALAIPREGSGYPIHVVTVVRFGEEFTHRRCKGCKAYGKFWETDSPVIGRSIGCECALKRIDGGDPDAITETEKELDNVLSL